MPQMKTAIPITILAIAGDAGLGCQLRYLQYPTMVGDAGYQLEAKDSPVDLSSLMAAVFGCYVKPSVSGFPQLRSCADVRPRMHSCACVTQ
jgi:hypothetical protein